jgi:hypothetical protein
MLVFIKMAEILLLVHANLSDLVVLFPNQFAIKLVRVIGVVG